MVSPESFAAFIVVNFITWPAFAIAYYYVVQRHDENLIDSMERSGQEMGARETEG